MLTDKRYPPHPDMKDMLRHLQEVNNDFSQARWPQIRHWSQMIVDQVYEGQIEWSDEMKIQIERLRPFDKPSIKTTNNVSAPKQQQGALTRAYDAQVPSADQNHVPMVEYPCIFYNENKCTIQKFRHNNNSRNFVHCCSSCWKQDGAKHPHTAIQCNKYPKN